MANLVNPATEWISSFSMMLWRCVSTVRAADMQNSGHFAAALALGDQLQNLALAAERRSNSEAGTSPSGADVILHDPLLQWR